MGDRAPHPGVEPVGGARSRHRIGDRQAQHPLEVEPVAAGVVLLERRVGDVGWIARCVEVDLRVLVPPTDGQESEPLVGHPEGGDVLDRSRSGIEGRHA